MKKIHLINAFKQAQQTTKNIANAPRSQTAQQAVSQLGQQAVAQLCGGVSALGDGVKV